jgi:DNA polymerase I
MELNFQVLDADYIISDSKPILRLFGRTDKNKSVTVFFEKFMPYFYILPVEGKIPEIKTILKKRFNDLVVKVETVKKHLPIGYSRSYNTLLKITLNNPAKTPFIRDSLKREKKIVKQVFEADILFKYRFMADQNISGMKWYRVVGNGTNTNTVKTDLKITAKKFQELKKEEHTNFKHMSFDIEIVPSEARMPDSEKDPIIIISLCFFPAFNGKNSIVLAAKKLRQKDKNTLDFFNEKKMLSEFLNIIDRYDPDIILGYNINNFDLPYIETRLRKNGLPRTIGRCNQKPFFSRKITNRFRNTVPGRTVVDVYDLVKEATLKFGLFKGLKRYGLNDISKLVLGDGKIDISHSEIKTHWMNNGKQLKKLLDYGRKDAQLPMNILFKERMLDKFFEISRVSGILLQDAIDGGESTRIENLLLREFNKRNYVIPCKPDPHIVSRRNLERRKEGLKGAFVLNPVVGFHDKCVAYLDFRSMYPSIIRSFNICPTTLITTPEKSECLKTPNGTRFVSPKIKEGIVPQILKYLLETRARIKNNMKRAKKPEKRRYLYAKQYAFKTIANAFYGHLGYIRAKLYILEIANAITSTGREMIKKTKKTVEEKTPYKVVYADTDSVMVGFNTKDVQEALKMGEEICVLINDEIHHILELKIESIFKTLLILSKKRYAGWNFEPIDGGWDESTITKGIETVRRDWCDLVSETLGEVLETILKDQDIKKSVKIVKNKIEQIKTGKMDIDKLVITKSVSKSLRSYKGIQPHIELVKKMRARDPATAPTVGDRVGFVITKGLQMISKRAEDPEYVKKHGLKIDSKYYIESQLFPPLERVFEALGVNRSDLTGGGKQLGLFEVIKKEVKKDTVFDDKLTEIDGFICNNCNNVFRRPPLSGKCNFCNGEIVFYKGSKKSRVYTP